MKVIVIKQTLEYLGSFPNWNEPLKLYGMVREAEDLAYVISIARKHEYLPIVGQLSAQFPSSVEYKLLGLVKDKDIVFYYRKENSWVESQKLIVDIHDIYKRTPFPQNLLDVINNSRVVMFGLGSMGSRIAIGLARSGVRHLRLVDPDCVSIENLSRHESDMFDLFRHKVDAVKDKILRVNPLAEVDTYPFDIFSRSEETKEKVFNNANLVIATTDKMSIQQLINYACWQRKIPALFAGCYDEARGGEVLFVLPGETRVCLECLRGGVGEPERRAEIDYSRAKSSEDYEGEPGLSSAINLISNVAEQYAIALLLRNEKCEMAKLIGPKNNLLFIGGALGKGFFYLKDLSCFIKPFEFITPTLKGPWRKCSTCQGK
jgi:molybdopterin/thiamine biosynthesis adenylyltransferase